MDGSAAGDPGLDDLDNRLGTTMIYVTHDQVEAMTLATRIVVLSKGNVEQVGTPYELYNFPRNRFVATFIGSPKMNMLEASVSNGTAKINDFGSIVLGGVPDGPIEIGIRAGQLNVGDGGDVRATGKVTLVEYLGSEIYLHVRLGTGSVVIAAADAESKVKVADDISLSFSSSACHAFDAEGRRCRVPLMHS